MTDDLTKWGENKRERMFNMWQKNFSQHSIGVQLFTSPLPKDADVILVGYNPGVGERTGRPTPETEKFRNDDFSLPDSWDYAEGGSEYDTAKNIRKYLFKNNLSYLEGKSIETNLYYLRSTKSGDHDEIENKVDGEVWDDYETFCIESFLELVRMVRPKLIVMFARGTYNRLSDRVSIMEKYEVEGEGAKYALTVGELDDIPVMVIPHISKDRFYYEGSDIKETVETKGQEILSRHLL